eukprot:1791034-Rhodomonas_salina.2
MIPKCVLRHSSRRYLAIPIQLNLMELCESMSLILGVPLAALPRGKQPERNRNRGRNASEKRGESWPQQDCGTTRKEQVQMHNHKLQSWYEFALRTRVKVYRLRCKCSTNPRE